MKELFGQRLREQRLKHHLTLEQVAEKADLSANYIGMVERGLKEPGLATIVKILNRKTKGLTQEQFAVKLNISDRHLGKIERGEGTASIDLLVEVAISLNTTLDFLILGVLDTPRERELNAQIKKQHQKIQIFKNKLSNLIDELDTSASV